jgi:hypothetical protein
METGTSASDTAAGGEGVAADGNGGQTATTTGDPLEPSQRVPWWGFCLLGAFLAGLGFVLIYSTVVLWPAVQAASATKGPREKTISWFSLSYTPNPDATLLILVVLVSALGSYVHAATSFSDYVGNRRLARSWIWWYLLRVLVGTSLAVLFYFAIRGGFFAGTTKSNDINPYGIAALSGLVGLFSKKATDKLGEIFDTAFRVAEGYGDDARSDSIVNPSPTLAAAEPPRLKAGDLKIVLVGTGFIGASVVSVSQAGGPELTRAVTITNAQRLEVTLEAGDVEAPGTLLFTVTNPPPGGGTSQPLRVEVDAPANGS